MSVSKIIFQRFIIQYVFQKPAIIVVFFVKEKNIQIAINVREIELLLTVCVVARKVMMRFLIIIVFKVIKEKGVDRFISYYQFLIYLIVWYLG